MMLTPYQQLAKVRARTGVLIQLDLFEELAMCEITDRGAELWIKTCRYVTSGAGHRITHRGVKIVRIAVTPGGRARYDTPEIVWYPEEMPVLVVSQEPSTLAHERKEWEDLCHRPGSSSWPLDSHARSIQGY